MGEKKRSSQKSSKGCFKMSPMGTGEPCQKNPEVRRRRLMGGGCADNGRDERKKIHRKFEGLTRDLQREAAPKKKNEKGGLNSKKRQSKKGNSGRGLKGVRNAPHLGTLTGQKKKYKEGKWKIVWRKELVFGRGTGRYQSVLRQNIV